MPLPSAAAQLPSASLGWLDGFGAAPLSCGYHSCYKVAADLYALVWPGDCQGTLADVAGRLMLAGQAGAVVPARYGQRLVNETQLDALAGRSGDRLRKALGQFGLLRQFSAVLPLDAAPVLGHASLRAKHQARKQVTQQLLATQALLQPFMQALEAYVSDRRPPQRCAADKAAFHFCIPRDKAALAAPAWAAYGPHVPVKALIGPLPPFAFLPSVLGDSPAR